MDFSEKHFLDFLKACRKVNRSFFMNQVSIVIAREARQSLFLTWQ